MLGERFENLEGPDGVLLQEPRTSPAAFSGHMKSTQGGEPRLAYYCGYLVSNYVTGPSILAKAVVATAVPDLSEVRGESWRRLKVTFPQRVGINGILVGEPPLVDIEMLDAVLA